MKLTYNEAYRLLSGLRQLERSETVKLDANVRWNIAVNIDRLTKPLGPYERTIAAKHREIRPLDPNASGNSSVAEANKIVLSANNAILAEVDVLGERQIEIKLFLFTRDDLKLAENPRITGDMIAPLARILKDFDTLEDSAE